MAHALATRRGFLVGTSALLIAGCGDDDPAPTASAAGEGPFPVTIAHKHGTTTIETQPQRVVTVGFTDQDAALALGVVPVGVREFFGEQPDATFPWAHDKLGTSHPTVLPTAELAFEKIASLRPDLILATYAGTTKADYRKLSKIASTVEQSPEFIDFGIPWDAQVRMIGRALGKTKEAAALVRGVGDRAAAIRAQHPEWEGRTALMATTAPGEYQVFASEDPRGRMLAALGFATPEWVDELAGDAFFATVSQEKARDLDAVDELILLAAEAPEDKLLGDFTFLDENSELAAAISFNTVLSVPFALEGLAEALSRT